MLANKLKFDFSIKSALTDERLFDVILVSIGPNRKSLITGPLIEG